MSGITGQEDISLRKEDVAGCRDVTGTNSLIFAHEATGGESSVDLTALVTPTSLSANGFINPSGNQIAASNLLFFRKNLRVYSSIRGRLHDYDGYTVLTSMRLGFLGFTLEPGEIIKGEISDVQRTGNLTADGRYYRVTYELPVGQTIVPLGVSYRINQNATMQGSNIRVYRNGARLVRNTNNASASPLADGNYAEVDAGNGFGTSIEVNTAPVGTSDVIDVDIGLYVTDGSTEVFGSLERLAGICYKMASDLAIATGNPVTDYMTATLSELDRAAYAATVLSNTARIAALENVPLFVRANSSTYTPTTSGRFYPISGAVITLTAGEWIVSGTGFFISSGGSPGYSRIYSTWSASQVASEVVSPAGGLSLSGGSAYSTIFVPSSPENILPASTVKVTVLSGTQDVCLNVLADMTTPANARISTFIWAQRVK